jgi:hypothetical protein
MTQSTESEVTPTQESSILEGEDTHKKVTNVEGEYFYHFLFLHFHCKNYLLLSSYLIGMLFFRLHGRRKRFASMQKNIHFDSSYTRHYQKKDTF